MKEENKMTENINKDEFSVLTEERMKEPGIKTYSYKEIKEIEKGVREMEKDIDMSEVPTITLEMVKETQKMTDKRKEIDNS